MCSRLIPVIQYNSDNLVLTPLEILEIDGLRQMKEKVEDLILALCPWQPHSGSCARLQSQVEAIESAIEGLQTVGVEEGRNGFALWAILSRIDRIRTVISSEIPGAIPCETELFNFEMGLSILKELWEPLWRDQLEDWALDLRAIEWAARPYETLAM